MSGEKKGWTAEDKRQMDMAAESARTALKEMVGDNEPLSIADISTWMKTWKTNAGYKRLCKVLIETGDAFAGDSDE